MDAVHELASLARSLGYKKGVNIYLAAKMTSGTSCVGPYGAHQPPGIRWARPSARTLLGFRQGSRRGHWPCRSVPLRFRALCPRGRADAGLVPWCRTLVGLVGITTQMYQSSLFQASIHLR